MEAVEEPPIQSTVDSVKINVVSDRESVLLAEETLCPTSNGVAESTSSTLVNASDAVYSISSTVDIHTENVTEEIEVPSTENMASSTTITVAAVPDKSAAMLPEVELLAAMETNSTVKDLLDNSKAEEIVEELTDTSEAILCNEVTIEGSAVVVDSADTSIDKVTLRTEVLVEKSDKDGIADPNDVNKQDQDNANCILSELSQGIELSEVLRSSDTTDNGENNNGTIREEVFNKEELLDILEGNDKLLESGNENEELMQTEDPKTKKILEAQIALKQLSRLRSTKKKKGTVQSTPRKRKVVKTEHNESEDIGSAKENITLEEISNETEVMESQVNITSSSEKKDNDSIVNVLVKDWDDDEPLDTDQSTQLLEESENLLKTTENLVKAQESSGQEEVSNRTSIDTSLSEGPATVQNKGGDDSQPQRRLARVIKKKVIFDPDNPDTFTKGKIVTKSKEPITEKEQPAPKKIKAEVTPQRAKSKSPTSKLQWKKPTPKNSNSKQNRRLTEIDKLLMDEGAVNMIYQLTPEAPKGKKNMRTKAEFIKKLQSSTPDGKEMKFRERKKEIKSEDGEPKKILGGKQRSSLSSSVKSPSVCEDFETHSADDSIIYRRHSSSSYSSACMSPRRLSDVEAGVVRPPASVSEDHNQTLEESTDKETDIFMPDARNPSGEIINKDDCLSIKEKLNTKLSLALNKRKKDTNKAYKPAKQKKISKNVSGGNGDCIKSENIDRYKHVSIHFDHRLAEICIRKTGSGYTIEMLKELEQALLLVDSKKDISITLLTSQCGTLCSDLDLKPLLGDKMEARTNYAHEIAEAVRSLLCSVERHTKLVVSGVWGACAGIGLALVGLSDVALASEQSSFTLSTGVPMPGVAALTTRCVRLSQSLISDLVVFGRRLSTAEALQGGLVSRSLPGAGADLARAIAKDLAAQPTQSVLLKKQLLNLKKSSESETTFLSSHNKERDLLVEYWTSVEGQDILRSALGS